MKPIDLLILAGSLAAGAVLAFLLGGGMKSQAALALAACGGGALAGARIRNRKDSAKSSGTHQERSRFRYIETASPRDMEAFIAELAPELLSMGATVFIDLYIDEPIDSERTKTSLAAMKEIVTHESLPNTRWKFFRGDPFMGIVVDLRHKNQVTHFSRLAHQVINAEAWCHHRQVFGTVESPVKVWVDMPVEVTERIIASASAAGAIMTAASGIS
ncbi:hypothetical protein [Streptomyces sp. NPDC088725]|uniref:hypothetical protein n=1 Tax=Streptomyces sp. NPDC088725 TaxID=3365873 RepID=UPI0038259C68